MNNYQGYGSHYSGQSPNQGGNNYAPMSNQGFGNGGNRSFQAERQAVQAKYKQASQVNSMNPQGSYGITGGPQIISYSSLTAMRPQQSNYMQPIVVDEEEYMTPYELNTNYMNMPPVDQFQNVGYQQQPIQPAINTYISQTFLQPVGSGGGGYVGQSSQQQMKMVPSISSGNSTYINVKSMQQSQTPVTATPSLNTPIYQLQSERNQGNGGRDYTARRSHSPINEANDFEGISFSLAPKSNPMPKARPGEIMHKVQDRNSDYHDRQSRGSTQQQKGQSAWEDDRDYKRSRSRHQEKDYDDMSSVSSSPQKGRNDNYNQKRRNDDYGRRDDRRNDDYGRSKVDDRRGGNRPNDRSNYGNERERDYDNRRSDRYYDKGNDYRDDRGGGSNRDRYYNNRDEDRRDNRRDERRDDSRRDDRKDRDRYDKREDKRDDRRDSRRDDRRDDRHSGQKDDRSRRDDRDERGKRDRDYDDHRSSKYDDRDDRNRRSRDDKYDDDDHRPSGRHNDKDRRPPIPKAFAEAMDNEEKEERTDFTLQLLKLHEDKDAIAKCEKDVDADGGAVFMYDDEKIDKKVIMYRVAGVDKLLHSQENNLITQKLNKYFKREWSYNADEPDVIVPENKEAKEDDVENFDFDNRYFVTNPTTICYRCRQTGHQERHCIVEPGDAVELCMFCLGNHRESDCMAIVCFRCNGVGHRKEACPLGNGPVLTCYRCRKKGHKDYECGVLLLKEPKDQAKDEDDDAIVICLTCGEEGHVNCHEVTPPDEEGIYSVSTR